MATCDLRSKAIALQKEIREKKALLSKTQQELLGLEERLRVLRDEISIKDVSDAEAADRWRAETEHDEQLRATLKDVFHLNYFRPHQLEAIRAHLHGNDVFLVMPTGGGKSLCFQLPAVLPGRCVTVVVSPLLALMQDQVMQLNSTGITAVSFSSSDNDEEKERVSKLLHNAGQSRETPNPFLLYLTPEMISKSKKTLSQLERIYKLGRLSCIAIDEAHCVSEWGHEFRPDYRTVGLRIRSLFPKVPVMCLTATATTKVIGDVAKSLGLGAPSLAIDGGNGICTSGESRGFAVFRSTFDRPNLFFDVLPKPSSGKEQLKDILRVIHQCDDLFGESSSGLIYCLSIKDVEQLCPQLNANGITAAPYHARLETANRHRSYRQWISGRVRLIVATIAFGMGINKEDVRFVIHSSPSKSVDNYYQEAGRAGRDGKPAYCVCYSRAQDFNRLGAMAFDSGGPRGLAQLREVEAYILENRCRRQAILEHFGEKRSRSASASSFCCDVCCAFTASSDAVAKLLPIRPSYFEEEEMRDAAVELLEMVDVLSFTDTKLSINQLADVLASGGQKLPAEASAALEGAVDFSRFSPLSKSPDKAGAFICLLLSRQLLEEQFYHTAYSTLSTIVTGPLAASIKKGEDMRIIFKRDKAPKAGQLPIPHGALNDSDLTASAAGKKRKLVA